MITTVRLADGTEHAVPAAVAQHIAQLEGALAALRTVAQPLVDSRPDWTRTAGRAPDAWKKNLDDLMKATRHTRIA
jgi:hypothetical protein